MRHFVVTTAMASLIAATPALACRKLIPSAKYEHSDIVVDGQAQCFETAGTCHLPVSNVVKGDTEMSGKAIEIAVIEAPPVQQVGNTIILGRCPQTFEPWKSEISGRFYLSILDDGTLFASHPADIADEELGAAE